MYYILENGNLKGRRGKSNCNCIAYLACVVRVSPGSYVVLQEAKVCQLPLLPGCEKFGLGARLGLVEQLAHGGALTCQPLADLKG